jgi:sugar diacid utilization regulator
MCSPGTPAYCTTETGRHDIAEILLKVALKHQKSNHSPLYNECSYKLLLHSVSSMWSKLFFVNYLSVLVDIGITGAF